MCILTYIPAGVPVPWDGIFNGACTNPDGHGWAVAKGDELVIGKSMDMFTAAEQYEEAIKALPGAVSIFHSRIATAGTVNEFNVHPFYVGGRDDTIVAHNGILPARWQPDRADTTHRSDTRIFADQGLGFVDNTRGVPSRRMGQAIGQAIGSYNKLVFLSVRSGKPVTRIINAHQGVWTEGVWHSNYSFEKFKPSYRSPMYTPPARTTYGTYVPMKERTGPVGQEVTRWQEQASIPGYVPGNWNSPYDWDAEDHGKPCIACKGNSIDFGGYCFDCDTCQDCAASADDCMCYSVRSATPKSGDTLDPVDEWMAKKAKEREDQEAEWDAWLRERKEEDAIKAQQEAQIATAIKIMAPR